MYGKFLSVDFMFFIVKGQQQRFPPWVRKCNQSLPLRLACSPSRPCSLSSVRPLQLWHGSASPLLRIQRLFSCKWLSSPAFVVFSNWPHLLLPLFPAGPGYKSPFSRLSLLKITRVGPKASPSAVVAECTKSNWGGELQRILCISGTEYST